ncbi:hypothetical protein [Yoonia sediminilitoris]|uniref:Uncharacterized protein n=1 Tax=Yoonia sediminilitoris TaxID=1286148 RepID=A0A2T6KET9_9RHOB|nr:hypothetical protein [Yoonia sediminilitoris]PUB13643.1 hypothetical protein C8N45_107103 [Yoonia sediminilitoris]RCW94813.1 hypothetical protein DFP92_107103 [Yoonia sediminilitoris]
MADLLTKDGDKVATAAVAITKLSSVRVCSAGADAAAKGAGHFHRLIHVKIRDGQIP